MEPTDILNGTLSLVFVAIAVLIMLRLALEYKRNGSKIHLLVGLTILFYTSPWWASGASLLVALSTGDGLPAWLYFLVGNLPAPLGMTLWAAAFGDLVWRAGRKFLIAVYAVTGLVFDLALVYLILNDIDSVGTLQGIVDVNYGTLVMLYFVFIAATLLVTGIFFAKMTMRADDPVRRWSGKLLLLAFIIFDVGALLDAVLSTGAAALVAIRAALISSLLLFYSAFYMPGFMKRAILKGRAKEV
jgi:hypothetical protein